MKLVLLGTGVPSPSLRRHGPSQAVIVNREALLIDCGHGTMFQLMRAGIDPLNVTHLFFTHHHYDHNIDYAHFVLSTWTMGRDFALRVYGPTGTTMMTAALFDRAFSIDINARTLRGTQRRRGVQVEAQDIHEGNVTQTSTWEVSAVKVDHLSEDTFSVGYRVDSGGKAIVVSGDTRPCQGLIELASGADILVHEVFFSPELEETGITAGRRPGSVSPDFGSKVRHTRPEEVGIIAREACVGKLVLSHLWSDRGLDRLVRLVKENFDGDIVVGEDLMTIEC